MPNYIDYILTEIKTTISNDSNYNVVSSINTIQDLAKDSGKYNVLIEIISDTKKELETEYYLNKLREADLTFMIYIGFRTKQDMDNTGLALTKQAEIWNDILKKFIDVNWSKTNNDTIFNLQLHNIQLLDYYPVNNSNDGSSLLGIVGNANYSLSRV